MSWPKNALAAFTSTSRAPSRIRHHSTPTAAYVPALLAGQITRQSTCTSGASVPALAAAVSNAGGLGVLGAAACSPDQLRDWIRQTRELTDKPFGVDTLLPASVRRGSAPQSGAAPQNPMDLMGEYQQFADAW